MSRRSLALVARFVRQIGTRSGAGGASDGQLLERFVAHHDESAFEALLRRHGPMVWGVCRRVLSDAQEAEDAFQATFLVLVRKASSVYQGQSVGGWLYRIAYRTALKARARASRRWAMESPLVDAPTSDSMVRLAWLELRTVFDEELKHLPEKYRLPVVLCYLQEMTYAQAARTLGLAEGTIASRLARAREKLRKRLIRRGLTLSAGLLGTVLSDSPLSSAVPAGLRDASLKVAALAAAGQSLATLGISANVLSLAERTMTTIMTAKVKAGGLAAVLLAVSLVASVGLVVGSRSEETPRAVESQPTVDERKAKADLHGDPLPVPKERAKPGPAKPIVVRQDAALQRMAMSPDGAIVATVGVVRDGSNSEWYNSTVKLWDARTGKLIRALDEEKDSHLEIAFSHDLLAIGVNGKLTDTNKPLREVRLLDARTLKLKHKIDKTLVPGVKGWGPLAFSPDGNRLVVTGYGEGAFLKLWDVEKEKFIESKADLRDILREQLQAKCLAFSPDGKLVAAEWDDGKIRLFDGRTGEFRKQLDKQPDGGVGVGGIAFSPNSKTLASRGNDNTVLLWDLTERKPPGGEGPDEKKIKQLIANLDADEFATREKVSKELEKLGKSAEGPMRDALAAAGISPEAKRRLEQLLKNMEGNPAGRTLKGQKGGYVHAIAYSRDGRWIAIGGQIAKAPPITLGDPIYEVVVRDAKTGEVKRTFSGLTERVHVIAFSPDGKTLAVCGGAHQIAESGNNYKASGELRLFRLE